jgi:hypothetical protein
MSYTSKSNEEVTKAFEKEQETKFQLLQSNIINCTHELRELQRQYKKETGKVYVVF